MSAKKTSKETSKNKTDPKPAAPQTAPTSPTGWSIRGSWVLGALAITIGASSPLWGPYVFTAQKDELTYLSSYIKVLESDLGKLKSAQASPSGGSGLSAEEKEIISSTLKQLAENQNAIGADQKDLANQVLEIQESLSTLEETISGLGNAREQLDDFAEIRKTDLSSLAEMKTKIDDLEQTIPLIVSQLQDLTTQTSQIGQALSAHDVILAQTQDSQMAAQEPIAARALAFLQLKMSADNGQNFSKEVEMIKSLLPDFDLSPLENLAATRIPTRTELLHHFQSKASDLVRIAKQNSGDQWWDQALNQVTSLVTVRPAPGSGKGSGVPALIAQIEQALLADDYKSALELSKQAPETLGQDMTNWRDQLQARLNIEQRIDLLRSYLLGEQTARTTQTETSP